MRKMKLTVVFFFSIVLALSCFACSDENADAAIEPTSDGDETEREAGEAEEEGERPQAVCDWALSAIEERDENEPSECAQSACIYEHAIVAPDLLPPQMETMQAHNNLDTTQHDCKVYLAFRTAPTHFASPKTKLYVVESEDRSTWKEVGNFHMDTDLREPRLLSYKGELFLYFAVLGENILDFEPRGMMVTKYLGDGEWTEPQYFYGEGFIPWRVKVIDSIPYMLAYVGGENIYDIDGEGMEVHWLTTEDGLEWRPVIDGQPVVLTGGGSETDFTFMPDGSLIGVSRNELGDESGWGMKVCKAAADSLGDWECVSDPKKYDSPLVFSHNGEAYLIGRRNVTETGYYDLGMDELSFEEQARKYELDYWGKPKRCALWKIHPETLEVSFLLDLPSNGDTCFPAIVKAQDGLFEVYNYSSPLIDLEMAWNEGQTGPTFIYRILVSFE